MMTTKRFREVRAIFRVKLRYCAKATDSTGYYLGDCVASIKQGEDVVLAGD